MTGTGARRALVADDNPAARAQIGGMLEELGFAVTAVSDGRSALSALKALAFDIAVLDRRMPDVDGPTVLARAPATTPPVIGVSSAGAGREDWAKAAIAAWIAKPVTVEALAKAIEAALGGSGAAAPLPVDLDHLAMYTEGDTALERELAELFRVSAERYIGALADAADDKTWRETAHGLKGTSRGIGAGEIARLAAYAETLLGPESAPKRDSVLAELRTAADEVQAFFARHLDGAG